MPCGSSKDACNQDKNTANGHCEFEDLDHSVLQQPLNLGVTNIKQILKCVQSGSKEIKDIILNECNIIYECKACVGLFRSLANFVYHKRCYCKKHMCEDMLLFEKFDEEETITVQPEAPKEKPEDINEESFKMSDTQMDLEKSDIAQETTPDTSKDIQSASEAPENSKEKSSNKNKAEEVSESEKPENTMISRRTRDKNAQNPVSSSSVNRVSVKMKTPEEPPLKYAKRAHEIIEFGTADQSDVHQETCKTAIKESVAKSSDDKKQDAPDKETKTKKIEFSKISGLLGKSMPSFPKIIFKTIDSNQNAVFQSDDKKKLETFGLGKKFKSATVETKVDNDKLIIVLKKDGKSDSASDSKPSESAKQKTDIEKAVDFHLTRRKRLMARSDCDVSDLRCLVCKTQFMSLKTLYFHMLSLHSKKRLYYPCPFCKTLFVQMYGVTRHLVAIHNKSKDQINKLREIIKKKSVWKKIDDANAASDKNISPLNYQIKEASPPPEIKAESPKETKSESGDTDSPKPVIKIGKNTTLHQCTKCNRVFGRKSSQVSHEKFCIMNNSPLKIEGSDSPSVAQPSSPSVSKNQSVASFLTPKPPAISKPTNIVQFKAENEPAKFLPLEKNIPEIKVSIRPKRGAEKQMHKDFVNSQTLKWRSANRIDTNVNSNKTPPATKKTPKEGKHLEKKVLSIMNTEDLACLKCDKKFSSYSNLRRHVAIHVGWTRFKCKFCDYQAYNKSQCWAHVQKAHVVDENEMEKSIVNLVNSNASNKRAQLKKAYASSSKHIDSPVKTPSKTNIFKCKLCNYQVYDKFQCWAHVQKAHDVSHGKIERCIVNLVNSNASDKKAQLKKAHTSSSKHDDDSPIKTPPLKTNAIPKVKISKRKVIIASKISEKKQLQAQKKDSLEVEKDSNVELIESKKEKPQPPVPVQKIPKKDATEAKKEKSQPIVSFQKLSKKDSENKKEKSHHIIPIQKLTVQRETNYKSVTTNNPTTIILSKKISSPTIQSILNISPESVSSTSKVSQIRTSPRKTEFKGPGEKKITTLVTRSNAYTKSSSIQIKLPAKTNTADEISKDLEKICSKKERLISEWFPKKDVSSSTVRRESAPLIIGLVPAGLNARAKSPAASPEKNISSP